MLLFTPLNGLSEDTCENVIVVYTLSRAGKILDQESVFNIFSILYKIDHQQ
jgi:hypothetical protein